jgi:hypothetical protein
MAQSFFLSIPAKTYDEFISGCQTKAIFQQARTEYQLDTKGTATLLRAFAVRYYPHELMTPPLLQSDRTLIEQASRVVQLATTSPLDLLGFRAVFDPFVVQFDQWLQADKIRVVEPFIVKLNQLRQLRTQVDKERPFYLTELKQLADLTTLQLIGQINGLGGESALSRIDELLPTTVPDVAFTTQFRADSATAFWATFRERLPSYEGVVPLLVDFIHCYMRLVPHRADLLSQITEVLDIEFIRQKIATQVVTMEDLRGYLRYILDLTKQVGSPADEPVIEAQFAPLIDAQREPVDLLQQFFEPLFEYYNDLSRVVEVERSRVRELFHNR